MSLKKVNIFDSNFAHAKYSTDFQNSKFISWERDKLSGLDAAKFFATDRSMFNFKESRCIGWIMEPPSISPDVYNYALQNSSNYKTILTYDKNLLESDGNFRFYPHSGCWIKPEDFMIYDKSREISIIASSKNQTTGHRLRHEIIKRHGSLLSVYGRGYNEIPYKLEALKDYRFSVVVENISKDYYFTEKLMDCLITGTIPIYYGCPSISKFFNIEGFIMINDPFAVDEGIKKATKTFYEKNIEAVKENFEAAKEYLIAEDWIFNKYPDLFE